MLTLLVRPGRASALDRVNGKMDTKIFGMPKEPTGASNDARGKMGPPSFEDARFDLASHRAIRIRMR